MFRIEANDPWHPRLVGSPADTMGDFPMAVAYSESLDTGRYFELDHERGMGTNRAQSVS